MNVANGPSGLKRRTDLSLRNTPGALTSFLIAEAKHKIGSTRPEHGGETRRKPEAFVVCQNVKEA